MAPGCLPLLLTLFDDLLLLCYLQVQNLPIKYELLLVRLAFVDFLQFLPCLFHFLQIPDSGHV